MTAGRLRTIFTLIGVVALVAGFTAVSVQADGGAGAAKKKKCKKKKKAATSKKKKRSKKTTPAATPAPVQSPLVRATLTWNTDPPGNNTPPSPNLDLFVFDGNGAVASANSNPIANTAFSSNDTLAPGVETFTDNLPVPARAFSFGICYAEPDIGTTHAYARIDYVTADGAHHVVGTTDMTSTIDLGGQGAHAEFAGGPAIPAAYGGCP